jgi:hypothetical protein
MSRSTNESNNADFAFAGMLFSLSGWALCHASLISWGTGVRAHLLPAIIGVGINWVAVRRYRQDWVAFMQRRGADRRLSEARLWKWSDAAWSALLLPLGAMLGYLLSAGSVTLVIAYAVSLTFVPWSRIPVCSRHPWFSFVLVAGGAACALFTSSRPVGPINLALGAWAIWVAGMYSLMRAILGASERPQPGAGELGAPAPSDSIPASAE